MKRAIPALSAFITLALLTACANEQPKPTGEGASAAPASMAPAGTASGTATPAGTTQGEAPRGGDDFEGKGMYMTATSMALPRYKTMIADLKAAGGTMILVDGKDEDGIVEWPSKVALAQQIGATKEGPLRDIKEKIAYAHSQGIKVAFRVCCFHDPILAKAHPELDPRDKVNGGVWKELGRQAWVDPSQEKAQQYIIDLAKELRGLGADEIQFDYIRFPAMGSTQNAVYAFDAKAHPKHEIITNFLKRAYNEVHPTGARVSIDVYGIMAWAQPIDIRITGQLMEEMCKYTDVMCPMVYPSHFSNGFAGIAHPADAPYAFVHNNLSRLQKIVGKSGVKVRPWLQAMPYKVSNFTPHYIVEELKAAKECNSTGWLMWNAQNKYDTAWAGVKAFGK
jgi:hypothetical protein